MSDTSQHSELTRRQVLAAAGAAGLIAAVGTSTTANAAAGDGTPEQVHLTWGQDPATSVSVSWASPARAVNPGVRLGYGLIPAQERTYTDGLNGETVWTYHVQLTGLRPDTSYRYEVIAGNATAPFSANFRTAPRGRAPFRFTSFGDLATPNTAWVLSYGQAAYAVQQVESQQPLFHLLNGDLCYADLNPTSQPEVWRDFGNNNQASAAYRPWMPCPGNHELEWYEAADGYGSYLTRYYETDTKDGLRQAKVFTKPNNPALTATADVYARAAADAVEDATWSANRDPATGYGIAVFDVDPGTGPGNQTSITVTYLHAVGADGAPVDTYTELETFTLTRPRSDA